MNRSMVRIALVTWLVILMVIAGRVLVAKRSNSVYPIFSTAGAAWLAGEPIYRPPTPELDQYRYSPIVAAVFSAWSLLPSQVGEILWRLLNAAVLLAGVACWSRWQRPDWDRGAMLLLVIPLAIGGLNNGQCNALIAGLLLFAQVWFARGQFWAAGCAIAACTLLKEYPLALGLLFALIEPRRFTPRLLVCVAAGLLLPFAFRSPDYVLEQYRAWTARMMNDDRSITAISLAYRDLHLLLRVYGLPITLMQYRALELSLAGACALFVWRRRESWSRQHATWVCGALASCWMTLAGPATESPTYVLAAPLLAACVLGSMERSRWRLGLSLTSYALFTFAAIIVWFPGSVSGPVHQSGIQPLAALLMSIVAVTMCRRELSVPTLQPAFSA